MLRARASLAAPLPSCAKTSAGSAQATAKPATDIRRAHTARPPAPTRSIARKRVLIGWLSLAVGCDSHLANAAWHAQGRALNELPVRVQVAVQFGVTQHVAHL